MFPLEQTSHVGAAKNKRPRLTNGEIIFEEFQRDHNHKFVREKITEPLAAQLWRMTESSFHTAKG